MKQLGSVAIVFAGLLAVVGVPQLVYSTALQLAQPADLGISPVATVLALLASLAIAFGVSFVLIVYHRQLADRWFDDGVAGLNIEPVQLLRVALIVLAVMMISNSLSTVLLGVAASMGQFSYLDMGGAGVLGVLGAIGYWVSSFAYPFGQLVLGVALVKWAEPISSRLWMMAPPRKRFAVEPSHGGPVCECPNCGQSYHPADYAEGAEHLCTGCHALLDGCA